MAKTKAKEPIITIDGVDYPVKSLSKEAIAKLESIKFCDIELNRLQNKIAITNTARNLYHSTLKEILPKDSATKH